MATDRVLLLSCDLTWRLEVDAEVRVLALHVLADILDRVDVERGRVPVDRQDHRLPGVVDVDLYLKKTASQGPVNSSLTDTVDLD